MRGIEPNRRLDSDSDWQKTAILIKAISIEIVEIGKLMLGMLVLVAWAFPFERYATINWGASYFAIGFAIDGHAEDLFLGRRV